MNFKKIADTSFKFIFFKIKGSFFGNVIVKLGLQVRELALRIILQHLELREKQLTSKQFFNKANLERMMKITRNLMNSPKFHETESGAIIIELLMTR